MKLHARFAALYGWCPQARGLSRGEVEIGLMANMKEVMAIQSLAFVESINSAFSGDALANLAERAGLPERDVIRIKMESSKVKLQDGNMGINQWQ